MPTRVLSEVTNRSAVRPPSGTVRQSGVGCSNARRTGSGKGVVLRHSRLFPKLVECSSSTRVSAQASQATSNTAATNNASESNQSKTSGPKICIVGGGFGGLYTALRLSTLVWTGDLKPEITLIDQRDRFVFKPLLYELLSEELELDEVAPRFVDLLPRGGNVNFVKGKVSGVQAKEEADEQNGQGKVKLENGDQIAYDYLVVAFGSGTKLDMVEGARDYAMPFCNLEDALELKAYLREASRKETKPTVAIVGAGVNGVELAASVASEYKDSLNIQLISPGEDILQSYPKDQRQNAWNSLSQGRVEVRLGTKVKKIEMNPETGRLKLEIENSEYGRSTIDADKVLWTAGQKAVPIPAAGSEKEEDDDSSASFFVRNEQGNVVTDSTLRMVNSSYVFALGDIAVLEGDQQKKYSFTAQVAFQQSDYVAWNIWSSINKQPLLPFQYQHLGDMMSLGQNEATVALPIGGLNVTGLPASLLRKAAYVYRMPTSTTQVKLGINWAARLLRDFL